MDELEAIKITFFQECEELLADLENGLSALQQGSGDAETVNAVFRAVHSVKGGAGAFGLDPLVRFAHVFETLLDALRSGKIEATSELIGLLLRASDVLGDHVQAARTGAVADEAVSDALAAELAAATAGEAAAGAGPVTAEFDEPDFGFTPLGVAVDSAAEPPAVERRWIVTFRPEAALYQNANDADLLLRELERLGPIETSLDDSGLPSLDDLDPEGAYLAWTVALTSSADETAIREVFEFADAHCTLEITAEDAGEGAASVIDLEAILRLAAAEPEPPQPALQAADEPEPARAAPTPPFSAKPAPDSAASGPQSVIRVDPERIDRLIDLVGELVINQAMLAQRVSECGIAPSSSLAMGLDELEQLTREIQDSVMAIRAQPVKSVFQRMGRLVREVAGLTGKQVRLVTDGEGTEVDKTVIERISEPITHMLRNAIDHGLESAEQRLAAGKPAEGSVRLAALHRGGRIVIEVEDDGRGIDRERVRAKALNQGLIAADAQLSDDEIDNLIFMPGFSTAEAVSDISGRGVGMDVVRRSVQALGGRISITSRPGEGSVFTLSLPLTLAVLDGMVIDVAGQTLVVPLASIVESLRPKPEEVRPLGPQSAVLAVRDSFVPLVDVGVALGYRPSPQAPTEGVVLLVESEAGGRAALVADAIQGQRQVVIKSLEANYQQVEGVAAATILGDGRVALILDVEAVVAMRRREPARAPDPTLMAAE